jgi:hypothetical protein
VLLRSKFMFQMLADPNCVILNWNVRQVVPELVMDNACTSVPSRNKGSDCRQHEALSVGSSWIVMQLYLQRAPGEE